jgi:sugar phosphate isomerase/epimerase
MNRETRRREFLLASAGALGASLVPAAKASPAETGKGPHLGCVTHRVLAEYDLETIIQLLEKAGFEGVELRTEHKHGVEPSLGAEQRARVRSRFEKSKVKLVSFGTICEFHSPDPLERKREVETGKQFVDLAHDTGAIGVKVRPNGFAETVAHEATIHNIAGSLHELGEYGESKGIQIWMEVHGEGTADPKVTHSIMKATQHKNVGLCWNCNETDMVNGSVKEGFELLRPWLRTIHLKDLAATAYPYPWQEFFGLLHATGFDGWEFCEAQPNPETERFLRWYKALWTAYNRPCAC